MNLFSGTTIRRAVAAAVALPVAGGATLVAAVPAAADDEEYKILVVGETLGFRHSHIDDTTLALIDLGEENGFTVDVWDPPNSSSGWWGPGSPGQPDLTMDSSPFTSAENLSQYATIVFASPVDNTNSLNPATPRLLDDAELAAFQGYIRGGGGYVGLHAATDTMHTVPWYSELTGGGARFISHPAQQTATMRVESPAHPSTAHLPAVWERFDEWYNYSTNPRDDVHVLLTLDESTYSPGNGAMGEDHPISWCHNFEGGRSWYEGAGHTDESWTDPLFLEHVLKGIEWTAGKVEGGGNCVTFPEVEGIVAGLDTSAVGDSVIAGAIASLLGSARSAADDGDPATAVQVLGAARALVDHLSAAAGDRALLATKIDDLVDWQTGLVDDGPSLDLAAEAELRTMGGKQYLAVRVLNEDETPVDITVTTPYGSKSFAGVAPAANAYQAFATRLVEVPGGEVTVTASAERDGETVTEEIALAYAGTA
ncbi:ThuA domain-containing protein [Cellulosimicrobium composti]|uniref:ThuA domain-containing protein n=1 Tax=Cellulosimicrobium composti TaxID=2672572 RepID=UPI000A08B40C|nr:type 1 glutamine amidotransferase [Cellulosimicrobium cellulans J34]SMF21548.1 Type 1 glutamine amidotransferase (GATase1) [Cellulosimicrobium cellulans J1]